VYASVELRLFRYVIAVAEELHFSRAALRERIAQPSLSKQIQDLEERLGVQLFSRDHRRVSLTDAGTAFEDEARRSLEHAERAVRAATVFKSPSATRLTIGYSPRINLGLLTIIRKIAHAQTPALRINFVSSHAPEQLEALCEDRIDVGLLTLPVQHEAIATKVLIREPLTVAIHASNRLSGKSHLKARELNGHPVISFPRQLHPGFHDHLLRLFKKEGFSPNIVQEVTTESEALYMVGEGLGVALLRPTLASILHPGIVFRKFRESSLVQETAVAYRRQSFSSHVRPLVNLIQRTVAQTSPHSLGLLEIGNEDDPRQLKLF
jgi:DNA-binding transcriptional LysR family regulator